MSENSTAFEKYLSMAPAIVKEQMDEGHFLFRGFTNAHDHLEFNLFSRLSNRFYNDYIEWGEDLHLNHHEHIQKILEVPVDLRIQFGVLKNLVNGFTGVVHHGGHHSKIKSLTTFPVELNYTYIHSLATEKFWRLKLNLPHRLPMMIHLGEGKSSRVSYEINQLLRWSFYKQDIIAIHTLTLSEQQAKRFKAVVWCPDSNLNLYDDTLNVDRIFNSTHLTFGTDSTLTASPNVWEHFRRVLDLKLVSQERLFQILTQSLFSRSATAPNTNNFVVARKNNGNYLNSFFKINLEDLMLVWIKGEAWLCDDSFNLKPQNGIPIEVDGKVKWVHSSFANVVSSLEKLKVELPLRIKSV